MRIGSSPVASMLNGAYGQRGLRTVRDDQPEGKAGFAAEAEKKAAGYRTLSDEAVSRAAISQEKDVTYSQAVRAATGSSAVTMAFASATSRVEQAGTPVLPVSHDAGAAGQDAEADEAALLPGAVSDDGETGRLPDSGEKADAKDDPAVSAEIAQLKQREQEVIAHEAAHKAAGGQYAGATSYTYTTGPDGQKYIDGGEVSIHTPATDDPEEALKIAETVHRAALAPANPSSQDISVAASALQDAAVARAEMARAELAERQDAGQGQQAGKKGAADGTASAVSGKDAGSAAGSKSRQASHEALADETSAVSVYGQRKALAAYASQSAVYAGSASSSSAFHAMG